MLSLLAQSPAQLETWGVAIAAFDRSARPRQRVNALPTAQRRALLLPLSILLLVVILLFPLAMGSFFAQVIATVTQICDMYWDLVDAYDTEQVGERSVAFATDTLNTSRKQLELQAIPEMDALKAEGDLAMREQARHEGHDAVHDAHQVDADHPVPVLEISRVERV